VRGGGRLYVFASNRIGRRDDGFAGLAVRFLVNVAALWLAQAIVPGFDIHGLGALLFGAAIFGIVNAVIRPVVAFVTCLFTVLTLGLFTLIINTLMLALTAWAAGIFDLDFEVEGFLAAFFGALIIAIVSTLLTAWAERNILRSRRFW
jgi:putative membrane protein